MRHAQAREARDGPRSIDRAPACDHRKSWQASGAPLFSRSMSARLRPLLVPFAIWAICAAVYAAVAGPRLSGPTADNHYVHLANSLLHGQLGVIGNRPPGTNDWACYDTQFHDICAQSAFHNPRPSEHWYVSFPPFPAVVILPAVAIFGPTLPDAAFWAIFGGLAPAILFILLRWLSDAGKSDRTELENLGLTFLFAFGTVFFFTAVQGAVWFSAHVVACALIPLYLLFAFNARKPFWAGLMLGLCFLTRPTTAALVIFFVIELLRVNRLGEEPVYAGRDALPRVVLWLTRVRWRRAVPPALAFAAPIVALGAIAMWMNAERWEDPFEFGHRYLLIAWRGRIERWGLFNYHYVSKNLAVLLASLPWLSANSPHLMISRHGLALWVTTPNLLWTLWPKRVDVSMIGLYAAAGAVMIWNLMYQNSGWVQFGYRFSLDYMALLIVLIALSRRRLGSLFYLSMLFAIALNTFGAITFDRAWEYYDSDSSQERLFQPD